MSKTYASSFNPLKVWLYPADGSKPIDLKDVTAQIQYHEDIFWPSYGATLLLSEKSVNLISSLPLQGYERVVFEVDDLTQLGDDKGIYTYEFRLWTISNRVNTERKQSYTIGLISEEGLKNEMIRINRVMKGNSAVQVQKILKEYLQVPDEKIDAEPSSTTVKVLPTKKSPFSLIRSLLSKTISEKSGNNVPIKKDTKSDAQISNDVKSDINPSTANKATGTAGYLFFQTRKGFTFRSMDSLTSSDDSFNGRPSVSGTFFYSPAKTSGSASLFRIQELVYGQEINLMKKMREGAYSSIVSYFNINTHEYEEHLYSLSDMWKQMAHMGSQDKLPAGQEELSKYPSRVMSTIVDHEKWNMTSKIGSNEPKHGGDGSNNFPDFQKHFLSQVYARAGILQNQQLTISITGHLELCAGDKIEVRVPNQKAEVLKDEPWDQEHSGTYLIKNLNHQFNMGEQPSAYSVLELVRDSYGIKDSESKVS